MNDKLFLGIALGMLGGVLLATNSVKTRQTVKDGQEEVKKKVAEKLNTKKK